MDLNDFDFHAVDDSIAEERTQPHASAARITSLTTELETAAASGDIDKIGRIAGYLSTTECLPSFPSLAGSALNFAIDRRRIPVVEYLLAAGTRPCSSHAKIATKAGDRIILDLLLRHGWNINEPLSWSVPPALSFAVRDPLTVEWYLVNGANPNAPCALDITPLSAAVQYGSVQIIEMLFASGGDILSGQLLHYAIWRTGTDRLDLINYLVDRGSPINSIMYYNHQSSYQQRKSFGLGTPVHDAAATGDLCAVRFLLERGGRADLLDTLARLPAQRARDNGHTEVESYLIRFRSSSRRSR